MTARSAAVFAVLAALLVGGCAEGDAGQPALVLPPPPPTTTSTAVVPESTLPRATTTTTTAPTADCDGARDPLALGRAVGPVDIAVADLDADRRGDIVFGYVVDGERRVSVELATRVRHAHVVPGPAATPLSVLGGTPLALGEADTAFVDIGVGDDLAAVALFDLRPCGLARVVDPAGRPATLVMGESAGRAAGLWCAFGPSHGIRALSAEWAGDTWATDDVDYRLRDGVLVELARSSTALAPEAFESERARRNGMDCQGVSKE